MNASNTNSITEKLQEIVKNNPNTIKACVAQEALEHSYDDIKNFFSDLQQHGCISGMIGSLIYYVDTHKFYEKYYSEIEEIRTELEDSFGKPLEIKGDLKNHYSWLSFEEVSFQLANELGIEI
jgi:hypothetical protein